MAAQMKPEPERPGTTMTRAEIAQAVKGAPAGQLPTEVRSALAERKQQHLVAAKISEMNWGKGLDPLMQRAVAAYLRENALDVTEIDVLGGRIYRNANYYLRRLSELIEADAVEYARPDFVHADPRLEALAKGTGEDATKARAELQRRAWERIERNIPDTATAACVFRVKLRGMPYEVADAKWIDPAGKKPDPVGLAFPTETVISRAARRTMKFLASQIPALKRLEEELEEQGVGLSEAIREARVQHLAREQAVRVIDGRGSHALPAPDYGAAVETALPGRDTIVSADDPYGLNAPAAPAAELALDDARPQPRRRNAQED